jgi:hypothetical protein
LIDLHTNINLFWVVLTLTFGKSATGLALAAQSPSESFNFSWYELEAS